MGKGFIIPKEDFQVLDRDIYESARGMIYSWASKELRFNTLERALSNKEETLDRMIGYTRLDSKKKRIFCQNFYNLAITKRILNLLNLDHIGALKEIKDDLDSVDIFTFRELILGKETLDKYFPELDALYQPVIKGLKSKTYVDISTEYEPKKRTGKIRWVHEKGRMEKLKEFYSKSQARINSRIRSLTDEGHIQDLIGFLLEMGMKSPSSIGYMTEENPNQILQDSLYAILKSHPSKVGDVLNTFEGYVDDAETLVNWGVELIKDGRLRIGEKVLTESLELCSTYKEESKKVAEAILGLGLVKEHTIGREERKKLVEETIASLTQ